MTKMELWKLVAAEVVRRQVTLAQMGAVKNGRDETKDDDNLRGNYAPENENRDGCSIDRSSFGRCGFERCGFD